MASDELSREDIEALTKDLDKHTAALTQKTTADAVERAKDTVRKEVEREYELKAKLEEQAKRNAELEAQLKQTQASAQEQYKALQDKVDSFIGSKAVVSPPGHMMGNQNQPDPFNIDRWSESKVEEVEKESARAFFGDEYDKQ